MADLRLAHPDFQVEHGQGLSGVQRNHRGTGEAPLRIAGKWLAGVVDFRLHGKGMFGAGSGGRWGVGEGRS